MNDATTATGSARTWPRDGSARVPAWVYTDPALFAREMDVFFQGPSWNYVGLECEVVPRVSRP